MKELQLTDRLRSVLGRVQVNMPWKDLPGYFDTILKERINPEIGFRGEDLDVVGCSEVRSIVEKLKERGCRVTFHGPFWELCSGSVDPLVRQVTRYRLSQFLDVVAASHPEQVVCHTGYDPRHHGEQVEEWVKRSLPVWEPLVVRAEALGIPLLIENVWEYGPEIHRLLFEHIPSQCFGFCLDVGHQNAFSRTPLSEWLEEMGDFIMEVHLHDNDSTTDTHSPIGSGGIDFELLFRFLHKRGTSPILTLEPHRDEDFLETLAGLDHVLSAISVASEEKKS